MGTEKLTQVSYQSYLENSVRGFTTELRGICCGQDLSYVILTLGMTEQAVQEIENASNVYMSVNSNGVLSKFDCSGNDHDDHIRIDAYFDTEDSSIQLALTFEADILTAISYYLR